MARSSTRCLGAALVLAMLLAIAGAAAQQTQTAPAHNKGGSKTLTKCHSLAACATCTKSGRSLTCLSCRGGAELVSGRCQCPAGSGRSGSAGTARAGTSTAHSKNGSGGHSSSSRSANGCSPCADGFYSAVSRAVGSATCLRCPQNTVRNAEGTSCLVAAGYYYNSASRVVSACSDDSYCLGGDFADPQEGQAQNPCPTNTGTDGGGKALKSECEIDPGYYFFKNINDPDDEGQVLPCLLGKYCPGGGGFGTTPSSNDVIDCPRGLSTANTRSANDGQCTVVLPGYYWDPSLTPGSDAPVCNKGYYCEGGLTTDPISDLKKLCPDGLTTVVPPPNGPGADAIVDCDNVLPGFYWDGSAIQVCDQGFYCPGGFKSDPIGDLKKQCPLGTTTAVPPPNGPGADAIVDCDNVLPGFYYDASAIPKVQTCPVDNYCPGGVISGNNSPGASPCPTGSSTNSLTGQDDVSDCKLIAPGYYMLNGVVTICPINSYCPGGVVTGPNGPGLTACPAGSTTQTLTGRDELSDCVVPPGYYMLNGVVTICPLDFFCPGGAITSANDPGKTACPTGLGTNSQTGQDEVSDCNYVQPGYYLLNGTPTICPADNYCPGGIINGNNSPTLISCGANSGTNSLTGRTSINDCVTLAASCSNNQLDSPPETDVDCGGGTCLACANGKNCLVGTDCISGFCSSGVCATPAAASCSDGIKNGAETDVDCGGSCANKCTPSKMCTVNADCTTNRCSGGVCICPDPQLIVNGACVSPTSGGKCYTNGNCGLCTQSCGNSASVTAVCNAFGIPAGSCQSNQISGQGGGGRCLTGVCCVPTGPPGPFPVTNGQC